MLDTLIVFACLLTYLLSRAWYQTVVLRVTQHGTTSRPRIVLLRDSR